MWTRFVKNLVHTGRPIRRSKAGRSRRSTDSPAAAGLFFFSVTAVLLSMGEPDATEKHAAKQLQKPWLRAAGFSLLYPSENLVVLHCGKTARFLAGFRPKNGGLRKSSSKKEKHKSAGHQPSQTEAETLRKSDSPKSGTLSRLFKQKSKKDEQQTSGGKVSRSCNKVLCGVRARLLDGALGLLTPTN
ncbi:hypothetical protein GDO78_015178 [Eleutherodactylus coqui]|uniref:Uncharacterized protein n=1 Tax=Eleutherodactylus coqui TaxID=57060 RepID=A0A8J6E8M4_ELECQ|nr:hypothetical protein GDO78_015178 [Eleutherodactylus coqui]